MLVIATLVSFIGCKGNSKESIGELTIGDLTYDEACRDFFFQSGYISLIQSAQGYEQFLGLDTSKDLKEQECKLSETGQSWYEYLLEQAQKQAVLISSQYQAAIADGYKDEDSKSMVLNYIEYYSMLASDAGFNTLDEYLSKTFGEKVNTEIITRLLTEQAVAEKYVIDTQNSMEFSDEELKSYYEKHKYEYMEFSYLYAYVSDSSTDVDSLMNASSEDEFKALAKELTGQDVYEMLGIKGSELGDETVDDAMWISSDERKAGDTYLGTASDARYVLYYIGSDDLGYSTDGDKWLIDAKAGLKDERISDWKTKLSESISIEGGWN